MRVPRAKSGGRTGPGPVGPIGEVFTLVLEYDVCGEFQVVSQRVQ